MRWPRFFRRRYWDEERSRELEAYLEIETGENIARGMSPEDARYAARKKLGNPTRVREEIYRMNTLGFVETLWQDLRYGARLLRINLVFSLIAIASLTLGIGANTAIFQLLDAVRLRPLPVKNPKELAEIGFWHRDWYAGHLEGRYPVLTNPLWEQIRDHQQALSGAFAWGSDALNLSLGGQARYAQALWVSGDFFNVLGVPPLLGRVFNSADDRRGCGFPGAVISYSFWKSELGGDASVAGRKLMLEGHPFEVIGVTPATFFGVEVGRSFDVAVPLCSEPMVKGEASNLNLRNSWWLAAMGRLKPGWLLEQASVHLSAISPGILEESIAKEWVGEEAKHYRAFKLKATPASSGFSTVRADYESPLWLLLGIAGLVLLIACANLANLMLARASAREREMAVRLALGASRSRLARQLLAESLLLAAIGAVLGAWMAQNLSRFLVSFLSTQGNPAFVDLTPDWRMFAFTTGMAILTCFLFGLTPALQATRNEPVAAMKAGGRGMTPDRERFGLRRMLVISQVALSLVLLVSALLFVRSFRNLLKVDAGFRQDGILIASVDLMRLKLPKERRQSAKQELIQRVRAIRGVDSAADTTMGPWGDYSNEPVYANGSDHDGSGNTQVNWVSPGYFKTLEIPLLAGRDFNDRDTAASPKVVVVNQEFARRFLEGGNPAGRTIRIGAGPGVKPPLFQIAGLVKNTKYQQLWEDFPPIAFFPAMQYQNPDQTDQVYIRSSVPLTGLIPAVKRSIGDISPEIILDFRVFQTELRDSLLPEQLMATLAGFFGLLAAVLATIGLYGVMSYMVARRRNEIGIRMALGADWRDVLAMILREAVLLLTIGLAAGTALALASGRTASSMLFDLKPYDPLTMAAAVILLAAVAISASYLPAQRAAKLDPMVALREE
jgi:putative ABC transport system permease protein